MPDIRFQGPPLTEEELRQQQMHQQRQQERYQQALHAQQHQRGPGPGRYHQGARAGQRPPQYKLQAKVTALERTGKKDPAIRFDVHVSTVPPMDCFGEADIERRRTFPSFEQHKSETLSALIQNL